MQLCRQQGLTTAGMKPVASGGIKQADGGLRNSDALTLQLACSCDLSYQLINPYCFEPPVAPHLAAEMSATGIDLRRIQDPYDELARNHECLITEGVGGWRVPLNDELDVAGLCQALQLPVVLVVGIKLGCINHALLTAQAIVSDGSTLLGWVANCVDPDMQLLEENIQTLRQRIPAPLLGSIPYDPEITPDQVAQRLRLPGS